MTQDSSTYTMITSIPMDDVNSTELINFVLDGDIDNIKLFLERDQDSSINLKDIDGWAALHHATYMNNVEIVAILCRHPSIQITIENSMKDTSLHIASYFGYTKIVEVLLDKVKEHDPKFVVQMINAKNKNNSSPFSIAATRHHKDTCQKILQYATPLRVELELSDCLEEHFCGFSDENLKGFLRKNSPFLLCHQRIDKGSSQINLLISKLPEFVTQLLDNSITVALSKIRDTRKRERENTYRIILDFGALEKYSEIEEDYMNSYEQAGGTYEPGSYRDGTYPLQVMVNKKRFELLKHPVVEALIRKKWESYAKIYYGVTLLFYAIFVSMLLTFELSQVQPFSTAEENGNSTLACAESLESCLFTKTMVCMISGHIVFVMSLLRLVLEIFDFVNETFIKVDVDGRSNGFKNYITSLLNILQIFLYSTAVVFSATVFNLEVMSSVQWQLGSFCVFAAFINLLTILRVFPMIGLPIIMFDRILKTFITRIALLFLLSILAFVIIFHMLLSQKDIFGNSMTIDSIFKVLSMGVSGVAYEDHEVEDTAHNYLTTTLLALIIFAVFVQVLFLNLALGLAIEDVKEIREHSEGEKLAIKIEHIYHSEKVLRNIQYVISCCCSSNGKQLLGYQQRFQNIAAKRFKMDIVHSILGRTSAAPKEVYTDQTEHLQQICKIIHTMYEAKFLN